MIMIYPYSLNSSVLCIYRVDIYYYVICVCVNKGAQIYISLVVSQHYLSVILSYNLYVYTCDVCGD